MRIGVLVLLVAVLVTVTAVAVPRLAKHDRRAPTSAALPSAELVAGSTSTLRLPPEVVRTMGLKTVPVEAAPPPPPIRLDGSLLLDPNRLTRVHTRFPGEVVEIGTAEGLSDDPSTAQEPYIRPVRFGDKVAKDQLLAILWSKDLGEKKSELVDALSRLTLDQETQVRLEELYRKGAIPERTLREAEQKTEADQIAVEKAKRTLRTWKLSEKDIDQLVEEAARIHERRGEWNDEVKRTWARVEVRASIDGMIVEKNVAVGDVVDTQLDLFKIADLRRLDVLAHVYEEDLPLIEDRPAEQRQWKILLKSDSAAKPLAGRFDQIGSIIDPTQHTALVMGWVDNAEGRLRMGQFITATIDRPPPADAVAVPAAAVVDRSGESLVFVQTDPKEPKFTCRRVLPIGHTGDGRVYLSSRPKASAGRPLDECPQPGELVVTSGGLELAAAIEELNVAASVSAAHGG